jgi:hypothetical protein
MPGSPFQFRAFLTTDLSRPPRESLNRSDGQHPNTVNVCLLHGCLGLRAPTRPAPSSLTCAVPSNWDNVETALVNDTSAGFINATSSCGCAPDNPSGQPVGLSVGQNFGAIELSWMVGSACESGVSVSRSLIDPVTREPRWGRGGNEWGAQPRKGREPAGAAVPLGGQRGSRSRR